MRKNYIENVTWDFGSGTGSFTEDCTFIDGGNYWNPDKNQVQPSWASGYLDNEEWRKWANEYKINWGSG